MSHLLLQRAIECINLPRSSKFCINIIIACYTLYTPLSTACYHSHTFVYNDTLHCTLLLELFASSFLPSFLPFFYTLSLRPSSSSLSFPLFFASLDNKQSTHWGTVVNHWLSWVLVYILSTIRLRSPEQTSSHAASWNMAILTFFLFCTFICCERQREEKHASPQESSL